MRFDRSEFAHRWCRLVGSAVVCAGLAGCTAKPVRTGQVDARAAVAASAPVIPAAPVVAETEIVRTGGSSRIAKVYKVAGSLFTRGEKPQYEATGVASWYGPRFHGRLTANGETFDRTALTAAHPTLPLPSYVRVTNLDNDRSVVVRVNDRGPYVHKRLIDVSERTAELLRFKRRGMAPVRVEYLDKAPLDAADEDYLLASYRGPPVGAAAAEPALLLASNATGRARPPLPGERLAALREAGPAGVKAAPQARPAQSAAVAFTRPDPTAEAVPAEAVEALVSPARPDARILLAFETAGAVAR